MAESLSWEEMHYVTEWVIRIVMLGILPLRRTPAAARSWLLLIFFLPIPGFLLFLAIGATRTPEWRLKLVTELKPLFTDLATRLKAKQFQRMPDEVEKLAERLGNFPATGGNAIELLTEYDTVTDKLIADIDGARVHVRIVSYIFADDATGRRVIEALARATARGIACHVLLDPIGSLRWMKRTVQKLRAAGVETRAALPMRLFRKWTRRDMRNHRKLFLIDGRIGYAGSQNIVDANFRKGVTNRELVARVTGPAVAEMEAVFLADWYLETQEQLQSDIAIAPAAGDVELQLLPSGPDYGGEGYLSLLIWLIQSAEQRVTIVTPYFIPDEGLLAALKIAVLRGVKVELIVSSVAAQPLVHLAQCSYYDELLVSGASLYWYSDYLLHAKLVVVDERIAIIGSSNADIRSFKLNAEISLLVHDRRQVRAIEKVLDQFRADAKPVVRDEWRQRGLLRRFAENLARLVSPLL